MFVVAKDKVTKVSASQLDLGQFRLKRLGPGQALLRGRAGRRRRVQPVVEPDRASVGKTAPGESKLRIEANPFFKRLDRGANGIFVSFPHKSFTAQIGFVGGGVLRGFLRKDPFFGAAELRIERDRDVLRYFLLDPENVVEFAIIALGPEMVVGRGIESTAR